MLQYISLRAVRVVMISAFSLSWPLLLAIARREKRLFEASGGQDAGEEA